MYTIHTIVEHAGMLVHLNQAASWIQTPTEFVNWTDRDFEFGQPIMDFIENGRPQEVIAVKQGATMLAYAELHRNAFGWVIARVLVHPEHRNKGLARQVMQATIDRAFQHGFVVSLFCVTDNLPAKTLYQSMGFSGLEVYAEQNMQRMAFINPILGQEAKKTSMQNAGTSNGLEFQNMN